MNSIFLKLLFVFVWFHYKKMHFLYYNQKGLYFSKKVCVLVKVVIGNSVWFDFLISGLRTA